MRISDQKVLLEQFALELGAPLVPTTTLPGAVSATVRFAGGGANERVYGLGEHRSNALGAAAVNMVPFFRNFEDSEVYGISHGGDVSIPWLASTVGYGFVWNSPAFGWVNVTAAEVAWSANATQNVDFWVTTTPADADPAVSPFAYLMSRYVDAVGHAPRMPWYATGFIQCKDRYRNQTQLLDVARGYVSRGLPISTIVIDWQHWVNQGDWSFNPQCWPDPVGMVAELKSMGIEPMVTFWPFQSRESQHWGEFNGSGYLVKTVNGTLQSFDGGDQYLVDETNATVRAAVFDAFWQGYGSLGFKTIWLDAAEPERMDTSTLGTYRYSCGTDAECGEGWIQQHVRTFQDGFAAQGIAPSDYFVLPRHAWAGSWRYSAALWSGDIQSTFDELAIQIKVLQGVMMSGVSLWTTDIGGYWNLDVTTPEGADLIVRWFQFGAFSPLFRLHGHRAHGPPTNECGPTNGDNEVWNLAPEPQHYAGIVKVMQLREDLRAYVAAAQAQSADTGLPVVRPMFLQYPLDGACQGGDVEDQFMFGDDWLVAPVYAFQAANRSVYLPALNASYEWVYWWNQTSYGQGGARVTVGTPIDEFPLFYRSRITPAPPAVSAAGTALYNAERADVVYCVSQACHGDNNGNTNPAYGPLPGQAGVTVDSTAWSAADATGYITVNGVAYPAAPLLLWFSFAHMDNFVATNATPPDATYTAAGGGVDMANGYVLAAPAPGAVPLNVYFKAHNATWWDYATAALSATQAALVADGYALQFTTGWVLPATSA